MASPFFEVEDTAGDYEGSLEIDTDKDIRFVSMGLRGGLFYTGIKFFDARRLLIANYTWSNNTDAIETP